MCMQQIRVLWKSESEREMERNRHYHCFSSLSSSSSACHVNRPCMQWRSPSPRTIFRERGNCNEENKLDFHESVHLHLKIYIQVEIICIEIHTYIKEHDHCHYQLDCVHVTFQFCSTSQQSKKRDHFIIINVMNIEQQSCIPTCFTIKKAPCFVSLTCFILSHAFCIQSCCHLLYPIFCYLL